MTGVAAGNQPSLASVLPLSRRLREGTREVHERVETAASFNRQIVISLPELDESAPAELRERLDGAREEYREVYRRFLIAAHGFESAVDAAIADSPAREIAEARGHPTEPGAPAALIRDDLRRVFGAGAVAAAAAAGVMAGLAPPCTLAELVGTEYVRRGSRAGGAVIAAVVHRNLGLTRESGASFLMQYGKRTRGVIIAFKDWVDSLALAEADARLAVAAAVGTFEAVQAWHAQLDERFARG